MIQGGDQVLKTDEVGRVRTPAARRENLLDEFERSGLSGPKFAALAGIKYPTFAAWAQQRRRQRGGRPTVPVPPNDPVRWLEAVVEAAGPEGQLRPGVGLQLPGGVRLELNDPKQVPLVAALVRALEKPC
jgi:hypothetical protein